jgi:hypothetical protein
VQITVDRRAVAHRELDGTVERIRLGVSQLALDPAGTFLYLAPLNRRHGVARPHADLLDRKLAAEELATRVESHAQRPSGNGLIADDRGRVVVADVEPTRCASPRPRGRRSSCRTLGSSGRKVSPAVRRTGSTSR